MHSTEPIRRYVASIVLSTALILGTPCPRAYCKDNICIDKVANTPDMPQVNREAGFVHNGQQNCAPAAVSNSFMWLANNGFERLRPTADNDEQSQIMMIKILTAGDMMNTTWDGSYVTDVMRAVGKYVTKSDYRCEKLEYQGWRPVNKLYKCSGQIPDLKWMEKIISNPAGALWLNIGFYVYDKDASSYTRNDGHWVTVVGYGADAKGKPDPSILIIHDPSPRSGHEVSHDYCHLQQIEDGSKLVGDFDGFPRSGNGFYIIKDGLYIKRGSDYAIIDCAVGLIIGK